jgi:hypothetical protein
MLTRQTCISSRRFTSKTIRAQIRLEGKICTLGDGLFHKNHAFEAGDKKLALRLAKVEEAVAGVRSESKTLQTLQALEFPFRIPELICLVTDDSRESKKNLNRGTAGPPPSPITIPGPRFSRTRAGRPMRRLFGQQVVVR